ncbi:ABC transporter transmembrane domain-containing protein [Legionella gresilensis]|uniref:ABC transporter transmembrane domain-containing protein n=1 Tax=Legionella gresilensis TaxID=91823 RepID=UPI0010413812|nr:ABC transporter ATP-binding protein [Legionella gresilensis]
MIREPRYSILEILDYSTIFSILLLALFTSSLSLVVPIAAQTLVNLIAFGKLLRPVITLSLIVLILMASLGALSIWQVIVTEIIQQKMMVKVSLDLTKQFTHLSIDNFSSHYGPELVNRYFEISTVKKSLASLLLYGITLGLQLFFGLILLLFYHPAFLFFDLFIVISILLIVFIPYKTALKTAKEECTQKHNIGAWLEEILMNRYLFKFDQYHRYAITQTDKRLVEFLQARKSHFKQLIKHQVGFYSLSAIASSLLLGLGGYLVIKNQLSLGQLVASEIVLGIFIYAFKRFGALIENYYDLMASADKLNMVLNLPTEQSETHLDSMVHPLNNIELIFPSYNKKGTVAYKKPLCIISKNFSKDVVEQLLGFKELILFSLKINDIPIKQAGLIILRRYSLLISEPQWFSGSIYDNLVLNHRHIANEFIVEKLKQLELADKIMNLPQGLHTIVHEWQSIFNDYDLTKFLVLRGLIAKPQLLIIDRALDNLDFDELNLIISLLINLEETLVIITTQRTDLNQLTNQLVIT